MKVQRPTLDLRASSAAHDLTPALWTSWAEAASVTLDRLHAETVQPCMLCPTGRRDVAATLAWKRPDDRTLRSHGNATDATEAGAYAVATLAVHALDGWRVIARTPTESGADLCGSLA